MFLFHMQFNRFLFTSSFHEGNDINSLMCNFYNFIRSPIMRVQRQQAKVKPVSQNNFLKFSIAPQFLYSIFSLATSTKKILLYIRISKLRSVSKEKSMLIYGALDSTKNNYISNENQRLNDRLTRRSMQF